VDELWQRYRSFWVPVLYGVGAFLFGLIVVHIMTDDPEAGRAQNEAKAQMITKRVAPSPGQIKGARDNSETLMKRVESWARRVDQRHGEADDALEAYSKQALRASILRGALPADEARFDGDKAAAAQASGAYETLLRDGLDRLRTQDPNVAFSRIKADVVQTLAIRANRADVDVGANADEFGLSSVASVERADLPRRMANLALIATIVDVAIRENVRSIDGVSILPPLVRVMAQGPDVFLLEWPVKIELTGTPEALMAVLNVLTDPERPTPLGPCSWKQTQKKDGMVKAEFTAYSVRVKPDAPLGLESEGGE
jgi:hypothetical protein